MNNKGLTVTCIKYIERLDTTAMLHMADVLLEMPAVNLGKAVTETHMMALSDASAYVYPVNHGFRDSVYDEALRAMLYLFAVHYPGLVSSAVNAD